MGDTAEGFTRSFKEVVALEDVILSDPKLFCSGEETGNVGRLRKAIFAWVDAGDCTWFELVEEASQRGEGSPSVRQPAKADLLWSGRGGLHAQNITVTDSLAKEPAFSVLTPSHGGRSGKGGRRPAAATLAPDAFETNQAPDANIDVFPGTGFDALGRP